MKILTVVMLAVLVPLALFGQSSVDKLVAQLESVSKVTVDNWRYSTTFSEDPTRPGFDDSQWATLAIDRNLYIDSCWIRKEVTLPERLLGQATSGTVRLLVSVDDYGYLFVNGENRGYFPWDGEFELTKHAQPGQKFLLVIKAINTGGPLRLLRAQILPGSDNPLARTVDDFSLGLKVAQKLLSPDTYQTNARVKVDPGVAQHTPANHRGGGGRRCPRQRIPRPVPHVALRSTDKTGAGRGFRPPLHALS
jgi:hypothetical protein